MGALPNPCLVKLEPIEDGWWLAVVQNPEIPGCHTQAPTIEEARARIREAIAAATGDDDYARTVAIK